MALVTARALVEKGMRDVRFAVRDSKKHGALLEEFPTSLLTPFAERYMTVGDCDLLVTCVSADEPVVEPGELKQVMRQRRARPLLVVDLGVPRNVAAKVGNLDNVFLHDIDSLQNLIARNLDKRRVQVPAVEEIVADELRHLLGWYQGLDAEPLVAELQRRAEQIRRAEVEAASARFPPELHGDLDRLTRALVRKILHHPSARLRAGGGEQALAHRELARELFQLGEE
jgi:glutamyl-tRNA reductase